MLQINVDKIPDEGLTINHSLEASEIDLLDKNFKATTPLRIKGVVMKAAAALEVQLEVKATYEFICGRCLDPVQQERTDPLKFYVEIDPTVEFVNLGEDIRQELLVGLAWIDVCQMDDKGICPICGIDGSKIEPKVKKGIRIVSQDDSSDYGIRI